MLEGAADTDPLAGRSEDGPWEAFLAECKRRGLSNTNGMRRMIRTWVGMPEPVPLEDTGSGGDRLASSDREG